MDSISAPPKEATKKHKGVFDAFVLGLKPEPDSAAKAQALRSANRFSVLEKAVECRDAYEKSRNPLFVGIAGHLAQEAMSEGSPDVAEAIFLILYGMTNDMRYARAAVSVSETIVSVYSWELPQPVSDGGHKGDKG